MANNEPQRVAGGSYRYSQSAIAVGIALVALSFLPVFASGRERWTKEHALELQQASLRIQELTHKLGSQTPDIANRQTSQDYRQALDRFEELQNQLNDARARSGSPGVVLRVVGLLLVIGGATSFAMTKQKKTAELRPFHSARST